MPNTTSNAIVSSYGIHFDDKGTAYLMQGRGGTNAVGLKHRAPFDVRLESRNKHCNHQIPLNIPVPNDHHWDFFMQMIDDPLVRAMMPIPKQGAGAFYVDDPEGRLVEILILLSKLSSPILRVVNPAWAIRADHVINELQNTNIQPFVVSELTAKDSPMVNTIGQACTYAPRTVVLAGQPDVVVPPSVKRITTELDTEKFDYQTLLATPWEALGATVVKKWMRKEWPPTEARSGRKAAHR